MSRVWVKQLQPINLHGFGHGEIGLSGLEPGLNVVLAPNASGKSTLADSIGFLFDPLSVPKEFEPGAAVAGVIETPAGEAVRVVRRKDAPFSGFSARRADYRFDLMDLIEGLERNQVEQLETTLASGIPLAIPTAPRVTRKESETAKEAFRAFREARQKKADASQDEDLLGELKARLEEAKEARLRVREMEGLLGRQTLSRQLNERIEARKRFLEAEPGIEKQASGAADRASDLATNIDRAARGLESLRTGLAKLRPDGELPNSPLTDAERAHLARLVSELGTGQSEVRARREMLAGVRAEAVAAREQVLSLLPSEEPSELPQISTEDIAALNSASASADVDRRERLAVETLRRLRDEWHKQHPQTIEKPDVALAELSRRLAVQPPVAIDRRPVALLVIVGALAVLASAPVDRWIVWVGAGLAVLAGLAVQFALRPQPAASDELTFKDVPKDLAGPASSLNQVVNAVLKCLAEKASQDISHKLDALAKQSLPEDRWKKNALALRLKCQDPLVLAPVAAAIQKYQERSREISGAEEGLKEAEASVTSSREGIRQLLEGHGFPCLAGQETEATSSFVGWFDEAEAVKAAERDLKDAQKTLQAILKENGADSVDALVRRDSACEAVRKLQEEAERLRSELDALAPSTAGEEPTHAEVERELEAQRAIAEEYDTRHGALAQVQERIRMAEQTSDLPWHEAAYRKSLLDLEAKWRKLVRDSVDRRLKLAIREKLQTESLPALVSQANGHVAEFTSGRFQLELGDNKSDALGFLMVRDASRDTTYPFQQLSMGTKVHVILALRLAMVEDHEQRHSGGALKFPLVADEALAVSDPEASRAVVEALTRISKERQVILFTNQPEDVRLVRKLDPTAACDLSIAPGEPIQTEELDTAQTAEPEMPVSDRAAVVVRRSERPRTDPAMQPSLID